VVERPMRIECHRYLTQDQQQNAHTAPVPVGPDRSPARHAIRSSSCCIQGKWTVLPAACPPSGGFSMDPEEIRLRAKKRRPESGRVENGMSLPNSTTIDAPSGSRLGPKVRIFAHTFDGHSPRSRGDPPPDVSGGAFLKNGGSTRKRRWGNDRLFLRKNGLL
jgi:hypothetical protein